MTTTREICNNETLILGVCYGMPVCGFCYDFGQFYRPSREYEIFNLTVIGVLLPMLGIVGLMGNCVSAFIFSRKSMRTSLNSYLSALALSDMTIVITSFFLFFLENMRKRSSSIYIAKCYALLAPIMFPLGLTAQTLSVFLTLAGAFDCFVLVTAGEHLRRVCCTISASKKAIIVIVIAACSFNLPHIFEITVVSCWSMPYKQPGYDVCPTALRLNETYYKWYYVYLYTIVMAAGPLILLIFLNAAIIISMRRKYSSIATKVATRPRTKSTTSLRSYAFDAHTLEKVIQRRSLNNRRFATLSTCRSVPCDFCYRQKTIRSFDSSEFRPVETRYSQKNGQIANISNKLPRNFSERSSPYHEISRSNPHDKIAFHSCATEWQICSNSERVNDKHNSHKSFIHPDLTNYFCGESKSTAKIITDKQKNHANMISSSTEKANETTDVMTLVLVVFLFISCNIMPLTVNFLELLLNLINPYLIDLSNLMVVLNSSCNFIIYYIFCESYRITLHKQMRKVRRKTFGKLFGTANGFTPKQDSEDLRLLTRQSTYRSIHQCSLKKEESMEYNNSFTYINRSQNEYRSHSTYKNNKKNVVNRTRI